MMTCNNRMYFQANNAANSSNIELWACDPLNPGDTAFNAYQVFDEIDNGKPKQLTDLNGNLIFATTSTQKLYVYDDGEAKVTPTADPMAYGPAATGLKNQYIERYQLEIGDTSDYVGEVNIQDKFASNNSFVVYPNPANDFITINLDIDQANVKILDINGSLVWKGTVLHRKEINVSGFASGVYALMIEYKNNIQYTKLVID